LKNARRSIDHVENQLRAHGWRPLDPLDLQCWRRCDGGSAINGSASARSRLPACTNAPAPVPLIALKDEPPPRLVVDAPIPSQLAEGRVVISLLRAQSEDPSRLRGSGAGVSPRLGHLHITVDDGPYRWLDTSGQPVVVNKLPPGPHRILIELVDPTHKTLDRQVVSFTIPEPPSSR
jgi:hypothetical protein